jgi:hypothetical protein
MTVATGLQDARLAGGSFAVGAHRVCETVEAKARQCRVRNDGPTILFLGTLHQGASWHGELVVNHLLTGAPQIAFQIHIRNNVQVGADPAFSATELHGAAFVTADGPPDQPLGTRNTHVAAVLVGMVGMFSAWDPLAPTPFVGALHPEPAIPFDPLRALPGVRCLRLRDGWRDGSLETEEVRCAPAARAAHYGPAH